MKFDHALEAFNRISEEKRNKIIDSAVNEFAEHGYESANINNIALKAEVSVGAMYKYFKNKEDLYLTVIHFGVESLKGILEETIKGEGDLLGKIEKIIRAIQAYSRSKVNLTKLYNQMTNESHSSLVWEIVSDMEGVTAGLYASFIEEAKEQGMIRADVDARLFAYFLDNLFVLLQFSYSCEYYKERLKMFVGEDVFDKDDLVEKQLIKFIRGAFFLK